MPLWEAAADTPFLAEMGRGTLDRRQFLDYIVQDSIYLRDYLKAFAMGIYKSRTLKEIQVFYSVLGFVNDSENETRLKYLADNGMTDADVEHVEKNQPAPPIRSFCSTPQSRRKSPKSSWPSCPACWVIMMCSSACWSATPLCWTPITALWCGIIPPRAIGASCEAWTAYCNEVCEGLDEARKEELNELFKMASRHELYFWEMAGGKNEEQRSS